MDRLLVKLSKHINNLQWEIDRMSSDGQDEYSKLIKVWNKVLKQYKAKGVK